MVKLAIDYEHTSRAWWEAGGRALWEGICEDFDAGKVIVDADLAASWLAEAARIPGWDEGPEYAPHPVRAESLAEDDAELY